MANPKEKSQEIIDLLHSRLIEERYFSDSEFFEYNIKMRGVGKASSKDNMAWAYLFACNQDADKALHYFRKSLNYQTSDISFARNYFVFLFKHGRVKELGLAIDKAKKKDFLSGSQHVMFEDLFTSILKGSFKGALQAASSLINLKQDLSKATEAIKIKIESFLSYSDIKDEGLKKLGEIYSNLIEKHALYAVGRFDFRTYPDVDVNHISLIVSEKHKEIIGKLNYELSYELASTDYFDNANFSASIDMLLEDDIVVVTNI